MSDDDRPTKKSTDLTRLNLSTELAELLNCLDLSPSVLLDEDALAIDRSSSCSSGSESVRKADIEYGYPEQTCTVNTIDRKVLLEEFALVTAEAKIQEERNNFFHDQLVEHFKRKQMMRVYGEPNETDTLRHRYERKLSSYEQLRNELQAGEENFKEEINLLRENLHKKIDEADAAVEDLVSKERVAGAQAYANGKLLPAKEIQALITRELGKIKEISKIRVRYARLRDSLVEKEVVYDALNILTPNLDREDYKRLEAENFYYKHELRIKKKEIESLAKRRNCVCRQLTAIRSKRNGVSRITQKRRQILDELKVKIAQTSQRRQIRRSKMKEVKEYFEKFESILGLRIYPEVCAKMKGIQDQHKEWLEKVAELVKEIKEKDLCLKALGSQRRFQKLTKTTDDEDTNENTSFREKSRRPPLGGGFLQAL